MSAVTPARSRSNYRVWLLAGFGLALVFVLGRLLHSLSRHELLRERVRHDLASLTGRTVGEKSIELRLVATGFAQPTEIQFVPGHTKLALVLEKGGNARLWRAPEGTSADTELSRPLEQVLSVAVKTESELGLLGLAFHPDFVKNGLFYLNYNPATGNMRTRVAEWKATPGSQLSGATEQHVLLEVEQPYSNHNGGGLAFGPDGMLYIGFGDGGSANDPHGNGQKLSTLLGKIVRINPAAAAGAPYSVPQDNPFVAAPQSGNREVRPEIWAVGLRNPWRFSFSEQGEMIVADVGQDQFEEVDLVRAGDNLGWNVREAGHCFSPKEGCQSAGMVEPIAEYAHALGNSITGGYVYRGSAVPLLRGKYVFGDFGSGRLWALKVPETRTGAYVVPELLGQWDAHFSTFARDPSGEMYVTDFYRGKIYQLKAL